VIPRGDDPNSQRQTASLWILVITAFPKSSRTETRGTHTRRHSASPDLSPEGWKGGGFTGCEKPCGAWRATPPHLRRGAFSTTPLLIQEGGRLGRRGGRAPRTVFPQPVKLRPSCMSCEHPSLVSDPC
jgi:hypothetical protein